MKADLVQLSIYPEPPGEELRAAFRKHVAETGQPETFPTISTSRPPAEGAVIALALDVSVSRGRRPNRDMAPCPICSPSDPKWLDRGTLIWCERTQAIYAIGGNCSQTLWKDGRLDRAINVLRQSEQAKADARALAIQLAKAPQYIGWAERHAPMAARADDQHRALARTLPHLRSALSRDLKASGTAVARRPDGDEVIGRVAGVPFLTGGWRNEQDLKDAVEVLTELTAEAGAEIVGWIDNLAPSLRTSRLVQARSAVQKVEKVHERLTVAAQFLSASNIATLGRWANSGGAPTSFAVRHTATRATFRHQDKLWEAALGIREPDALPV